MIRLHLRNRFFLVGDLLLLPLAAYLAYVLRLDRLDLRGFERSFLVFALCTTVVTLIVFRRSGIYARYWRYASVGELHLLIRATLTAVVIASGLSILICYYLPGRPVIPRSIPLIFLLLAGPSVALPRLAARLWVTFPRPLGSITRPTTLIFGAGDAGATIAREWRQNHRIELDIVGFLDDDFNKHGIHLYGLPVLGDRHRLATVVQERNVQQVIIAMPTAPGKTIREILNLCESVGVRARTIPSMNELLDGRARISQLRDVQIEDLLRREPVRTDASALVQLIEGQRVLITGGGGSIGSELCRQVLRLKPRELIILGHGENSIFAIQQELLRLLGAPSPPPKHGAAEQQQLGEPELPPKISAVIADIRFADHLRTVLATHRPQVVFHAAAHKHVPLMELNPAEAIRNNIIGTGNLLDASVAAGVERFVMISTDKAVNPTSVMGATKRIAELLVHRVARQSGKAYVAVRFGNVLGSRGSVVPTFKQQIAVGGPVTVTHPEMTRYFMTIPEAVQLVMQAAALGQGGEVFVLDMGEPIKIADLARDLIELSGLEVGRDIDIAYTGLRPGEKLYEELFIPGESYRQTRHQKILIADNASRLVPLRLDEAVAALREAATRGDRDAIVRGLQQLVPEFRPPGQGPAAPVKSLPSRQVDEYGDQNPGATPASGMTRRARADG